MYVQHKHTILQTVHYFRIILHDDIMNTFSRDRVIITSRGTPKCARRIPTGDM